MFAVVILGIGFILVAAIFPVAIQQSQATGEESSAAMIARQAVSAIAALASSITNPNLPVSGGLVYDPSQNVQSFPMFPPTVKNYIVGNYNSQPTGTAVGQLSVAPPAVFVQFSGARWEAVKGNAILPSDPRYAWTAFYSRENGSSSMNLIVIAMAARQRPIYDPVYDTTTSVSTLSATTVRSYAVPTGLLRPTYVCPDRITFSGGGTLVDGTSAATQFSTAIAQASGKPAGRYYRVGRQLTGSTYEIGAGEDMSLTAGAGGTWGTAGGTSDKQLTGDQVSLYPPTSLQATVAYAQLRGDPNSPGGRMQLVNSPSDPTAPPAATTGCFVVIADDFAYDPGNLGDNSNYGNGYALPPNLIAPQPVPGLPNPNSGATYTLGSMNGRIFRLGKPITEDFEQGAIYGPGVFDIDPQYGMRPPSTAYGASLYSPDTFPSPYLAGQNPNYGNLFAKVYIVGMGKDASTGAYGKEAQDIGVFSTIVPVQ